MLCKGGTLRLEVHLPPGHTFEGLAILSDALLVDRVDPRCPERILGDRHQLRLPVRASEAFCFVNRDSSHEVVVLRAPLRRRAGEHRSA